MNTENPAQPLTLDDLPGGANNPHPGVPSTPQQQHPALQARYARLEQIANAITADVEAAPMSYVADGGERAYRTAHRIDRLLDRDANLRIVKVLSDLDQVLTAAAEAAGQRASKARQLGDVHAGDYAEGMRRGILDALAVLDAAREATTGQPRTRQENAQAFANTIINGGTQ